MKQIFRILRFTKELKNYYIGVGAFTILLSVMSQLQPLFTKGVVDEITRGTKLGDTNVTLVALFALAIFLTDVGQTVFSNISGYIGDILSIKLQKLMSERYYKHMLSLPQSYFDSELTGTIINRMSRGITQITQFMNMFSNNFLQFIFSTVFSLGIVYYFSWQAGVLLTLLYPIYIYLTTRTSVRWQKFQKKINEAQDIASGRFAESIGQIKVVKSFLQEKRELRLFSKQYAMAIKTTYPQSKLWHSQDVYRRIVLNIIFFAVYVFIFVQAARGQYSLGTLFALVQYAALIRLPIFSISFLIDNGQRAIANTKDYFEAMDLEPAIMDAPGAAVLGVDKGVVRFDHVRFGYDSDKPVLKDLTFQMRTGTRTALVGESGEGKTTITSLLLRMYSLDAGSITIDGQDIAAVTQASLREQIAVVFQEPALFSGTIKENISYARPTATDDEIEAAAKAANAHEFIAKFEKAYETEIGERGLRLSGGQKQRIAIARALLKDAPILILDEATSSLDSKSERMVQEALDRLMKGRTTLIIAHRLSTIESVDQIVTLKNGAVQEAGSPHELAHSGGIYAQLLQLQRGADDDEQSKKQLQKFDIKA